MRGNRAEGRSPSLGCRESNKAGLLWPLFKPRQSELLKDDGTTTISVLETGKVFCDYFTKACNNIRPTGNSILNNIAQRETLENLGVTPTITEVRNATKIMANRKAAGEKIVSLERYKYLPDINFTHLYNVVVEFWREDDDPPEFHEAKLCIIEKKGDLSPLKIKNFSSIVARVTNMAKDMKIGIISIANISSKRLN